VSRHESLDPNPPEIAIPRKVVKGESHLRTLQHGFRYGPAGRLMGFDDHEGAFVRADHHPEAELDPEIVVAAIDGPLLFADADNFRDSVVDLVRAYQPHTIVIDMRAVTMLDVDGDKALSKLAANLQRREL
jgi:MFS superfamily sulfate permease-like transporter